MKYVCSLDTPVGTLFIAEENGSLTDVRFGPVAGAEERETPLLLEAAAQLREYFEGKRKFFDLPLDARGTPFQRSVWSALRVIPYGETWAYRDIAVAVGKPTAYRAVGLANNKNPISIVIPCHRVIGADGGLVGYGGGLDVKQTLLELEKKHR